MPLNYTPAFMTPNPYGMSVAQPRQSTPQVSGPMSYYGNTQYPQSTQRGIMGPQSGSVLGTNTYKPTNAAIDLGGNPGGGTPPPPNNDFLNIISSGYDDYFGQLDAQLNQGLPSQRDAQLGIAQSSHDQGMNQLGTQRTSELNNLETTQKTSLKDLSSNVRNLFEAGNNYLGSRGAGDSSAANQYSYAVTKMASKQRGDIMSQVTQRKQQIDDVYNNETGRLKSDFDQKSMQIASWFAESQNSLRSMIGQGKLNKSTDLANASQQLYNQALSAFKEAKQEQNAKTQMIQQWALNNSKSVEQAMGMFQQMGLYQPQQPTQGAYKNAYQPQVNAEGQMYIPGNSLSNSRSEETDIFGNRIG